MDKYTTLLPLTSNTSCGYHRITLPMQQAGITPIYIEEVSRIQKDKVLFFNRFIPFPTKNRFILDLDDYWDLPISSPHYFYWNKMRLPQRIANNIKMAECVLTTNSTLAGHISKQRGSTKDVYVVPNALPFDTGQFTLTEPGRDLVYAGGISHIHDIQQIEHLHVEYYGGLKGSTSLPLGIYMSAYNKKLASLVPLESGLFNACKSNLKILEAGAKGIGCIASKVLPYYNDVDKHVMYYGFSKIPPRKALEEQGLVLAKHVREHYHLDQVNKLRMDIIEKYL